MSSQLIIDIEIQYKLRFTFSMRMERQLLTFKITVITTLALHECKPLQKLGAKLIDDKFSYTESN